MPARKSTETDLFARSLACQVAAGYGRGNVVPRLFFTTDHYRGYPTVLINLARISDKQLASLLEDAWRLASPRKSTGDDPLTRKRKA